MEGLDALVQGLVVIWLLKTVRTAGGICEYGCQKWKLHVERVRQASQKRRLLIYDLTTGGLVDGQ